MLTKLVHFILFGNYFLAFCIVALSVETSVKNGFFIAGYSYYVFVFLSVVVYYTYAYISDKGNGQTSNLRLRWYYTNKRLIRYTQLIFTVILGILSVYFFVLYHRFLLVFSITDWLLLLLFPAVALLYYGVIFPARFRFRLRNVAWLKPFIIGFVCTGSIVLYPMLFHALQSHRPFRLSIANASYFLTNWLFTTAIAIMFDIKDFAADHNYRLQTFVVAKGLRATIFFILLPLATVSLLSFLVFASLRHFSASQITINIIPFFLLLLAAASLRRRKGILYYLLVIDGLLLAKAVFGITAMMLAE